MRVENSAIMDKDMFTLYDYYCFIAAGNAHSYHECINAAFRKIQIGFSVMVQRTGTTLLHC